jgi:hypothetical protein
LKIWETAKTSETTPSGSLSPEEFSFCGIFIVAQIGQAAEEIFACG